MSDDLEDEYFAIEADEAGASAEARRSHAQLTEALGRIGEQDGGNASWMADVLDQVVDAEATENDASPKRGRWVAAAVALIAAVVTAVLWPREDHSSTLPPAAGAFSVTRLDGGPVVRGRDLAPGDTVRVQFPLDEAVRVYFNDSLLVACPGEDACMKHDNAGQLDVPLTKPGQYSFVRVSADAPPATGTLDDDVAAALRGGFEARVVLDLEIR